MIECVFYDMSGVDFAGNTISIVQKGHPKQRAGVRTPWTPPLDPPLPMVVKVRRGGFGIGQFNYVVEICLRPTLVAEVIIIISLIK